MEDCFKISIRFQALCLGLDKSVCITFSLVNNVDLIGLCVIENVKTVAGDVHLETGLFGRHGLHGESL